MAVISKLDFEQFFGNATCQQLYHPWTASCLRANASFLQKCFFGSAKHFALVHLVRILLKYRRISKSFLKKELLCYLRTTIGATLVASHWSIYSCLLRKMFGRMFYTTITFVPGFLAAFYIFIVDKAERDIVTQLFAQMLFQVLIKMMEHNRILKRNLATDTFCFMITNAFLLYFLYEDKEALVGAVAASSCSSSSSSITSYESNEKDSSKHISILWPYQHSMSVEKIKTENPCFHFNECIQYISNGFKTYFKMGCAFQLLTSMIGYSRQTKKSPSGFLKYLLKWSNLRMGLFLSSYATINRIVTCWLCQRNQKSDKKYAFIGGFVSGLSFVIYPQLATLLSVVSATFLVWLRRLERNHPMLDEKLAEIVWCFCLGVMITLRVFHKQLLPPTAIYFIRSLTAGQVDQIGDKFDKLCADTLKLQG